MAQISGKLVFLEISTDDGTTWKQLVCLRTAGFDLSNTVITEETQCGVYKELGNPSWGFDFDAVVETAPGGTQASFEELLALANNGTSFKVRQQSPGGTPGTDFYISGTGLLSTLSLATPASGGLMAFSGRIEGSGLVDIAA